MAYFYSASTKNQRQTSFTRRNINLLCETVMIADFVLEVEMRMRKQK